MKKIVFLYIFLGFLASIGYAQKVTVKKDAILVDGQQYAILLSKGSFLIGQDFILKTLSGTELAYFKLHPQNLDIGEQGHYEVIFRKSGAKGILPLGETKKSIAKLIVENDLVQGDDINPEGERRFLQISSPRQTTGLNTGGQIVTDYTPIQRDRQALVFVNTNTIHQGNVLIGRYVEAMVFDQNLGNIKSYKFYSPDGVFIAEAIFKNIADTSGTCITIKDNKRHYVSVRNNLSIPEDVAKFLINLYYL